MVRSRKRLVVVPEQVKFHIYLFPRGESWTLLYVGLIFGYLTFSVQVGAVGVPSGSSISDHPCKTY